MLGRPPRAMKTRDQGFTLNELLVVLNIVALLAVISVPTYWDQRTKRTDASLKHDLERMVTVQNLWLNDNLAFQGLVHPGLLNADAFTASPGNIIMVKLNGVVPGGYCVEGFNSGASVAVTAPTAMTFNSASGGLDVPCS